jgi:DNA-binding transcriptional LysR family regulator
MHSTFLRYFDEVARQGSIRKAAAVLNMSSTTVNRKIISTEQELGIKLFHRNPGGVKLTSAGSIVLEHCRKTLFEYERMSVLIEDIRDMRTGHMEILSLDSITLGILPRVLSQFSKNYPQVTYSVRTTQPDDIVKAIANGDADIGLSFWFEDQPGVRTLTEKSCPIGAVMVRNHALAERNKLSIEDLKGYPLIRTIDARGGHSLLDRIFDNLAPSLGTRTFTNSLPLAKEMIMHDAGIGMYTKLGFLDEIENETVRFIPLDIPDLSSLKIAVLVSSTVNFAPVKHLLCNEIAKTFRQIRMDS